MKQVEDRPYLYLGAYALWLEAGRLLLCRIRRGGLAWGEPPEQGMVRELEEETGLRPRSVEGVAAVYSRTYSRTEARPANSVHHVGIVYRVGGVQGTPRAEASGSTDHCAWLTRAETERLPLTPLVGFARPFAWPALRPERED